MTNNEYNPDEYLVLPLMFSKPLPVTLEIDKCIKDYYIEVKRKQDRDYYHANKERILRNKSVRLKAEYKKNPDKFKEQRLKYYYTHREQILKNKKEQRENSDKLVCKCGGIFDKSFLNKHNSTNRHVRYLEQLKKD